MKKTLQFSGIIIFFLFIICGSVRAALTNVKVIAIPAGYCSQESKAIEGYYVSKPMDGETESCNLSVRMINEYADKRRHAGPVYPLAPQPPKGGVFY